MVSFSDGLQQLICYGRLDLVGWGLAFVYTYFDLSDDDVEPALAHLIELFFTAWVIQRTVLVLEECDQRPAIGLKYHFRWQ